MNNLIVAKCIHALWRFFMEKVIDFDYSKYSGNLIYKEAKNLLYGVLLL